jgi:hypothetical protein
VSGYLVIIRLVIVQICSGDGRRNAAGDYEYGIDGLNMAQAV